MKIGGNGPLENTTINIALETVGPKYEPYPRMLRDHSWKTTFLFVDILICLGVERCSFEVPAYRIRRAYYSIVVSTSVTTHKDCAYFRALEYIIS